VRVASSIPERWDLRHEIPQLWIAGRFDLDPIRRETIARVHRAIGLTRWCSLLIDPDTLVQSRASVRTTSSLSCRPNLIAGRLGEVNNTTCSLVATIMSAY
jgi:hypothetical protein